MKLSTIRTLSFVALAALSGLACSVAASVPGTGGVGGGGDGGGGGGGSADGGADSGGPANPEVNPYGVAYPTSGIGKAARKSIKVASAPGSVLENFKFQGYPDGNIDNGLQPMAMANFFDPDMKQFKVVVLAGSGNWCGYCQKEVASVVADLDSYKSEQIGFVNVVLESLSKGVAVQTDLDLWVKKYKINFPVSIFPEDAPAAGTANLQPYGLTGLPFNILVDARSMEILAIMNGSPTEGMLARAKTYSAWVDKNPASTFSE